MPACFCNFSNAILLSSDGFYCVLFAVIVDAFVVVLAAGCGRVWRRASPRSTYDSLTHSLTHSLTRSDSDSLSAMSEESLATKKRTSTQTQNRTL
jgi:hypothetical protein